MRAPRIGPVVALDFDGVICDSIVECMVTAYDAYLRFCGESGWVEGPEDLEPGYVNRFRRLRHLVRPAGEYWLLVHWILTRADDPSEHEFEAWSRRYERTVARFEPLFFAVRDELRARDMERWSSWQRMYPECADGWGEVRARCSVHVVTTKDLGSVQHFNLRWGLGLRRADLWTRERVRSKTDAIGEIARLEGCAPGDVVFVDDHPGHLREVAATGARCAWAAWGYGRRSADRRMDPLVIHQLSRLRELMPLLAEIPVGRAGPKG